MGDIVHASFFPANRQGNYRARPASVLNENYVVGVSAVTRLLF